AALRRWNKYRRLSKAKAQGVSREKKRESSLRSPGKRVQGKSPLSWSLRSTFIVVLKLIFEALHVARGVSGSLETPLLAPDTSPGKGDAPCLVWLTNPNVGGEAPPVSFCPVSCHRSGRAGCWRMRGFLPKPCTLPEAPAGSVQADCGAHEASTRNRHLPAPCGQIVEGAPAGAPGTLFRVLQEPPEGVSGEP